MTGAAALPVVSLHNGVSLPAVGFGMFQIPADDMRTTIEHALAAGYRLFDTAPMYGNEHALGRVLAGSGIDRTELFITTKVSNEDQAYDSTFAAVEASIERIGPHPDDVP